MNIFDHINRRAIGILAFVVAAAALVAYFLRGPSGAPAGPLSRSELSPLEGTVGRELLSVLSKMKFTELDASVFSDPVFLSMHDFGVEIASQPVGRRNPFGAFPAPPSAQRRPASAAQSAAQPAGEMLIFPDFEEESGTGETAPPPRAGAGAGAGRAAPPEAAGDDFGEPIGDFSF